RTRVPTTRQNCPEGRLTNASKNAESLQSQIGNLTGTSAIVNSLEITDPPKKDDQKTKNSPSASAHNSATTNRDQVQKAFAGLDETNPTIDDISQIRYGVEDSKGAARSHNLKPQADGVPAETISHPNNVAFRT